MHMAISYGFSSYIHTYIYIFGVYNREIIWIWRQLVTSLAPVYADAFTFHRGTIFIYDYVSVTGWRRYIYHLSTCIRFHSYKASCLCLFISYRQQIDSDRFLKDNIQLTYLNTEHTSQVKSKHLHRFITNESLSNCKIFILTGICKC